VAGGANRFLIGTTTGLLVVDSDRLLRIPGPPSTPAITRVGMTPDGTPWVIAGTPPSQFDFVWEHWNTRFVIFFVAAIVWAVGRWLRRPARPEFPATGPAPEFPPAGPEEPAGQAPFAWSVLPTALAVAASVFAALLAFGWLRPLGSSPSGQVIPLAILIGTISICAVLTRVPFRRMYAALRRADYAEAIRWSGRDPVLRGMVLTLAGRPAEAERQVRKWFERAASLYRSSDAKEAIVQTELGRALTDQGRYPEAEAAFKRALALNVGSGSPLIAYAEWYLVQSIQPEAALALLDQALAAKEVFAAKYKVREEIGQCWALRAWALAMLGRKEQAQSAIGQALAVADPGYIPELSGIHWRIGMALSLMGDRDQAAAEFRRAHQVDPNGKFGKLGDRSARGVFV